MIQNLADCFASEQEFYLDKITYNRIDKSNEPKEYLLNCTDNIDVEVNKDIVKLTVNRVLQFEPREIFELSISFGAILKFKKEKKEAYDWQKINLEEEFRENGEFVLGNLMQRISLLVAEITSSYGQSPLILFPGIAPKNN